MTIQRLDGAESYYVPSRTAGDGHLITVHDGRATCTCKAAGTTGRTCWAVREVMGSSGNIGIDALAVLDSIARDREILQAREAAAVASARSENVSWHRIAVAVGRTTEGVRRRYRSAS